MGLGGRLAFCLTPSVRLGGMGFNSGFTYESNSNGLGSYVNLKAGGITAEYLFTLSKHLRMSFGFLAGGGNLYHLDIISDNGSNKLVTYEKYSTFIVSPLSLFEFLFGKSYSIVLISNWIFGNKIIFGYSYGPCLHIGILFNK